MIADEINAYKIHTKWFPIPKISPGNSDNTKHHGIEIKVISKLILNFSRLFRET